jgi:hypothetical protein
VLPPGDQQGRPRRTEEVEHLVSAWPRTTHWGCRRIQGRWPGLAQSRDKLTVRHILRRHHLEPAPQRRKGGRAGRSS